MKSWEGCKGFGVGKVQCEAEKQWQQQTLKEELALNNNMQIVEFGANVDNHKREVHNAKEKWA